MSGTWCLDSEQDGEICVPESAQFSLTWCDVSEGVRAVKETDPSLVPGTVTY